MPKSAIRTKLTETRNTDALLAGMPMELRGKQLKSALRKGGNVVKKEARATAPKPGYPGDKPGLKPLRDSFVVKVKEYPRTVAAFIGSRWPDAAHLHLVEFGHRMVLWGKRTDGTVTGKPFFRRAADTTEPQQSAAIVGSLKSDLNKLAD